VIEGRIEGRRDQEEQGKVYIQQLMEGKEESYVQIKTKAEDRELWKIPGICLPAEQ